MTMVPRRRKVSCEQRAARRTPYFMFVVSTRPSLPPAASICLTNITDNSGSVLAGLGSVIVLASLCGCGFIYKGKRDKEKRRIAAMERKEEKKLAKQQSLNKQSSNIKVGTSAPLATRHASPPFTFPIDGCRSFPSTQSNPP